MKATVKPLSHKAKNRFVNLFDSCPEVKIEQERDGVFFFVSKNGRYCAWSARVGPDWELTLETTNNVRTTSPQP